MQLLPPGRSLLKDISENSQEGLDSSQGHSSSSHHSHMAASAFAALSQINGFQGEDHPDQGTQGQGHPDQVSHAQDQTDLADSGAQSKLDPAESAQAEQQTAQHEHHQAQSPDDEPQSDISQNSDSSRPDRQGSAIKASDIQPLPLTEHSLSALKVSTDTSQLSPQANPSAVPELVHSPTPPSPDPAGSQASDLAGSTPGSHTFDSELHGGIAALVQAPVNTDSAKRQSSGVQIPTDVDDAVLRSSAEGQERTDAASDSASATSRQPAEASQEAAAAVYSLGSDDEEDLTVVSSEDQAREAQVL